METVVISPKVTVIKPIRDEVSYKAALARLNDIFGVPEDHPDYDESQILFDLVWCYEHMQDEFKDEDIDPVEYVKSYMENRDLKQKDLAKMLDMSTARLSEFLNRKSEMTFKLAKKLYEIVGVPAAAILKNYHNE